MLFLFVLKTFVWRVRLLVQKEYYLCVLLRSVVKKWCKVTLASITLRILRRDSNINRVVYYPNSKQLVFFNFHCVVND